MDYYDTVEVTRYILIIIIDADDALLDAMTGNMSALEDVFMLEETEDTTEENQFNKRNKS